MSKYSRNFRTSERLCPKFTKFSYETIVLFYSASISVNLTFLIFSVMYFCVSIACIFMMWIY